MQQLKPNLSEIMALPLLHFRHRIAGEWVFSLLGQEGAVPRCLKKKESQKTLNKEMSGGGGEVEYGGNGGNGTTT